MAVFAVLADKPNPALGKKIASIYPPADFYEITDSQWLVAADTIPQTLAEQLEIRKGKHGRVVVIRTNGSASGWHSKTIWEWLNQKAKSA